MSASKCQRVTQPVGQGMHVKALSEARFSKMVSSLYSSWAEEYRTAFRKNRPEARLYDYKIKLSDQLEFVRLYLGFFIIDGKTRQQLERIREFLSLQKVTSTANYQIHFVGGAPLEVIVHVNDLKEIDFSDTHGLIGYNSIAIVRRDKLWTKKSRDEMFKAIKYDLEFDGDKFKPADVYMNEGHGIDSFELVFDNCGID